MKTLALIGSALLLSGAAQAATVVDFNELGLFQVYDSPLVTGGLQFENDGAGGGSGAFYVVGDGWVTGGDGNQLAPNYYGSVSTISLAGGGLFDLIGFDFSDAFDFADDPLLLTLTFDTTSGIVVKQYTADLNFGLQYAEVNVTGISSFTLQASDSLYGENTVLLDNITYDVAATGGVPEPVTWAMLVSGFGLVGTAARRRRTANRELA